MFDSYLDDTSQYGDGMLRYKLLESDQKGALEGDGTLDESQAKVRRKILA